MRVCDICESPIKEFPPLKRQISFWNDENKETETYNFDFCKVCEKKLINRGDRVN